MLQLDQLQFGQVNYTNYLMAMEAPATLRPIPISVHKLDSKPVKHEEMKLVEFYQCEKILDFKIDRGRRSYLIKWKEYDESYNTWECIPNISVLAYQLAQFQQLNQAYVGSIERKEMSREGALKKAHSKELPHFKRQLELLKEFAKMYLQLDDAQLQIKLAQFLENIENKTKSQKRSRKVSRKHRNEAKLQPTVSANTTRLMDNTKTFQTINSNSTLRTKIVRKSEVPENLPVKKELGLPVIKEMKNENQGSSHKKSAVRSARKSQNRKSNIISSYKDVYSEEDDEAMSHEEYKQISSLCSSKLVSFSSSSRSQKSQDTSTLQKQEEQNKSQKEEGKHQKEEERPQKEEERPKKEESRPQKEEERPQKEEGRPQKQESRPQKEKERPQKQEQVSKGQEEEASKTQQTQTVIVQSTFTDKHFSSERMVSNTNNLHERSCIFRSGFLQRIKKRDETQVKEEKCVSNCGKIKQANSRSVPTEGGSSVDKQQHENKFQVVANDGSTESLINLLKGNINLYELRDSKPVIREIVRFYKMGAEVILELVTEGEQGEPLKRFVGYDMMREYYPRELLRFLERQRAAVI